MATPALPPGFELEQSSIPALPPGFVIEPSQQEVQAAQTAYAAENRSLEPVGPVEAVQSFFSPSKREEIAKEGRKGGYVPPEPSALEGFGEAAARTARLAPALIPGGQGSILTQIGLGAGKQIAGEFIASGIESATGANVTNDGFRGAAARTLLNATPMVRPFSATTQSTSKNVLGLLGNMGAQSATNAVTSLGAEYIEKGSVSPSTGLISAGIGTFGGALNTLGDRITKSAEAREKARIAFEKAGVPFNEIPVQYIVPQSGRFSDNLVPVVDSIASQQDAAFRKKVLERVQAGVGDLVEGGVIAKELQGYVDTLDETQKIYAKQSNEAAQAAIALKQAEDNLAIVKGNPANAAAAQSAQEAVTAAEENLRSVRARDISKAAAAYALGQTPEGAVFSASEAAGVWENRVRRPMDELLKSEAARRFSPQAIGITPEQQLLTTADLNDVLAAVKKRLNVADNELSINLAAGLEDGAGLGLNEVRAVRKRLLDALDNAPEGNKRADAILLALDGEIANRTRSAIKGVAGEGGLAAYDEANKYYRGVMQAKTNQQGRALLGRQVNDEAAQAMVTKLARGNYDEYNAALQYIDTIAQGAPDIQKGMKARLNRIVRDSLVSKHTLNPGAENQTLNVADLMSELQAIGSRRMKGGKLFPVEELGFGSSSQIKTAKNMLEGLVGPRVSEKELQQFYKHPAVNQALSSGIGFSEAAKKAAAEIGAVKDAFASELSRQSGGVNRAEVLLQQARAKAKAAGMSLQQTEELIAKQKADPILAAFSGGRGFGLKPGEAQPDFGRFLDFMTDSNRGTLMEKTRLARAIEKNNPQLWDRIRSRFLMDKLLTVANPRNPNLRYDLNYQVADQIINPINTADRANLVAATRVILGEQSYNELKKMAPLIAQVAKSERVLGGTRPGMGVERAASAAGAVRGLGEGKLTGAVGAQTSARSLYSFIDSGRGRLAAFFLQNPTAFKVYQTTGSIQKAMGSIGPQRAALIIANDPELAYLVGDEARKFSEQK